MSNNTNFQDNIKNSIFKNFAKVERSKGVKVREGGGETEHGLKHIQRQIKNVQNNNHHQSELVAFPVNVLLLSDGFHIPIEHKMWGRSGMGAGKGV